jgi:hypothetical protein
MTRILRLVVLAVLGSACLETPASAPSLMTIRGAMKDAVPRLGIVVVRDADGRPVSFRSPRQPLR